ncbi:uncharacterized protein F4807DRAFT_430127 [Annulohypoxylon truncatum]|uniref:uncharacterized protein n=1 Tax=Annulohypoxylon truncatum TaxID=327061 RepID=UPI002007A5B8|nr:uncharacterized protein F4807DRAFT_430127 [Annulohypoxylon truncatum]KAI1208564.1 hypothetical protein F4807DRAFT_430127 [Annulohypoxylon truncatum]
MSKSSQFQRYPPDMGAYDQRPPQYSGPPQYQQPYGQEEQWRNGGQGGYSNYNQQPYQQPNQQPYQQPYQQQYQRPNAPPMTAPRAGPGPGMGSAMQLANGGGSPMPPGPLMYPVIIPQRRPKARDRGFVKAYAPDLMRAGIDQATFMAFLDGFGKALTQSPLLGAINLAGGVAGMIPTAIAPPIGIAVQLTAGVYQEVMNRKNQNAYLTKMNDELFRPRGLYCLIMAYAPNSDKTLQQNINTKGNDGKFRNHDGVMGSVDFPISAELIYPEDEEDSSDEDDDDDSQGSHSQGGQGQGGQQQQQGGMMASLGKAFEGFKDRRDMKAQRKYMRKNPMGALNGLLDPKVELTAKDREKQAKRMAKDERKQAKQERKFEKKARKHPEREQGPRKRKIKESILYLMIINMPKSGDMENAAKMMAGQNAGPVQRRY